MNKTIFGLIMMILLTMTSCAAPKKVEAPIPEQLVDETIAFVSPDKKGDWTIDCGGVWINKDLILTAYHCTVAAKFMTLTQEEAMVALLTREVPDSKGAPIYYANNQAVDVLDSGSSHHYKARVVATDSQHDLALVRTVGNRPVHRAASLADKEPQIGDEISTIGHPNRISYSYTHGYVSGFHSDINHDVLDIRGPFLKLNAVIVGGNSGGGVFNKEGQLIGICSFSDRNAIEQGFAIPSSRIKKLLSSYQAK